MVSRDSVAVVVVVRRHPERLTKTLSSLAGQVADSSISIANLSGSAISAPGDLTVVELAPSSTLSEAVSRALVGRTNDFVWILRDDTVVRPGALGALSAVFDTSPSVGVVGPKQLDADMTIEIREMGESISRSGFAVQLAEREMDQGQYDRHSDVLGVGEAGMMVRRTVWDQLDGFDPALPVVDGALDFCYRVRAAGWRVEVVPSAVIETGDSSLEAFAGEVPESRVIREEAKARAHRVLSYISAVAALFRGPSLLLGALTRGIARAVNKQPHPFAEAGGTLSGVVRSAAITRSRRAIALITTQPIDRARLFVTRTEMTRRRALDRDARRAVLEAADTEPRLGFGQLGAWMTGAAIVVGLILGHNYLGATALSGGGLLPLPLTIGEVWTTVGATWTPVAGGVSSAPDGFSALIAALATLTWWSPNLALVGLWLLAVPLSFVAGWVGAGAVTVRSGTAFVIATGWTLLPSLHSALAEGRVGAVIAHIAIPFAIRALASRGAVSAGWFALLAAAIWVSIPALAPVIVIATIVRAIAGRPAVLFTLIPAVALEWPRILEAVQSNPILYLADRGVPVASVNPPLEFAQVWPVSASIPFLDPAVASVVVLAVVAVAVVATVIAVIAGATRVGVIAILSSVAVVIWIVAGDLPLAHVADLSVGVAPGPLLDPLWFALLAGLALVSTSIPVIRGFAVPVVLSALAVVSVSTIALPFIGGTLVAPSDVRSVPAYVEAETRTRPAAGTLVITPRDDAIVAELQRGRGATLLQWTASATARRDVNSTETEIATMAGNLIVESGFDVVTAATDLNIRFVLLKAPPTNPAVSAIASHGGLTQVGQTANGVLWIVDGNPAAEIAHPGRNLVYLALAGLAVLVAFIAAIPTSLPRRRIGEDELVLEAGENDG